MRSRTGQSLADPCLAAESLRVRGAVAGLPLYPPEAVACACALIAVDASLWVAGVGEVDELVRAGDAGRALLSGAVRAACQGELPFPSTWGRAVVDDDWLEWLTSAGEWAEQLGLDAAEVLSGAGALLAASGWPFTDVGALATDLALVWDAD